MQASATDYSAGVYSINGQTYVIAHAPTESDSSDTAVAPVPFITMALFSARRGVVGSEHAPILGEAGKVSDADETR